MKQLQTFKNDLLKTRIVQTQNIEIKEGEISVLIESFAFTSNNVTYGVAGDTIGYWQFFKATEDKNNDWGCIPVWGFAKIIKSNVEELIVGERLFGCFPPGDILNLKPIKVTNQGFADGKEHRKDLPALYNNYIRLSGDANYDASIDNIRSLLFPLHVTSFCICDALEDEAYYEAEQILIVSASSKTAIGVAQGLQETSNTPSIIGLTSQKNLDFVNNLNCYDEVITYDQLSKVNFNLKSVMVDMAGSREILGTLHGSLGNNMLKCLTDILNLKPIKVTNQGFADGKEHRKDLPALYNNYIRLSGDANYDASIDNIRSLLFPLHVTSFCICDALEDEAYYEAEQILIVSASSKTAIGVAQGLQETSNTPSIIGLTSQKNLDFVNNLNCYDEVITYDQLSKVNFNLKSVMVDMAGSREILGTLHGSLGNNMLKCLTVGMTHWDNEVTAEDALGQAMLRERTEFFFAPAHIQKRVKDWGHAWSITKRQMNLWKLDLIKALIGCK